MDKITVVCHKDHDKGYEDFQGKCLLCVVDELMLEMGNLMIQKRRAEKREWVGYTNEDRERIVPVLVQSLVGHDEKTMAVLLKAILIDVEEQLKEKNT